MLTDLLKHKNPRFLCLSLSDRNSWKQLALHHEVGDSVPDSEALISLAKVDPLRIFLEQVSSLRLYCDNLSEASAFYIARPGEWEDLRSELDEWLVVSEVTPPAWVSDAVVFAEIPNSSVYYLYLTTHENGFVYEYSGDGDEFTKVADCFEAFLDYISTPNSQLMETIQCYTRFSDGESEIQWLPQKYLHD